MTRKCCRAFCYALFCLAATLAFPASADLTLTGRSSVAAMGMPSIGQEKLLLQKHRLRRDLVDRGRAYSYLFDLKEQQVVLLDHAFRTAEVRSLAKVDKPAVKAKKSDLKLDLVKTGKEHSIRHWKCEEHTVQAEMPAQLGTDPVTFRMLGTVWLAAKTPEQKEMAALREAAGDPNYLLGMPSMAQAPVEQTRAIGETIQQLTGKGILCGFDLETRYEGTGRMAEVARKMATHLRLAYESFSTDALAEDTFAIPASYLVTRR
jgi:hypothetical protein